MPWFMFASSKNPKRQHHLIMLADSEKLVWLFNLFN
jgi:hypothetical protein